MTINEAIQEFEDNAYHHFKHPVVSDEAMTVALKAMQEIAQGQRPELECAESVAEYIEREAAISKIKTEGVLSGCCQSNEEIEKNVVDMLESISAADVKPVVHGKWIKDKSGVIYCSECEEEHAWLDYRAPYCDTCGAKMDGGEEHG